MLLLLFFPSQVVVNVQFPKVVRTADLHVTMGTCLFDEALKVPKRGLIRYYEYWSLYSAASIVPVGASSRHYSAHHHT